MRIGAIFLNRIFFDMGNILFHWTENASLRMFYRIGIAWNYKYMTGHLCLETIPQSHTVSVLHIDIAFKRIHTVHFNPKLFARVNIQSWTAYWCDSVWTSVQKVVWVTDFASGMLWFSVSLCAKCAFGKAPLLCRINLLLRELFSVQHK